MGLPAKKMDRKYTYADYLTWPDDQRWEIIDGVAYPLDHSDEKGMSPAPARMHQFVLVKLVTAFENYLDDKPCEVYCAPFDVRLPSSFEEDSVVDSVVQPDLAVICDSDKLDDKGCKGAPDLVVEVLSSSTAIKDMREKYELYQRYGVREYWLVHPVDKWVEVFILQEDNTFSKASVYSEEDVVTVGIFPDLEIQLGRVFGSVRKNNT